MIKKKQISKTTIAKRKRQINYTPLYRLENMEFFLTNGNANKASIEKFADDQLDFIILNKDAIHINEFYLSKGIIRRTYYSWLEKSDYLKQRHELGKEIIGLRREKKMIKNNPSTLAHTLYQYSESWGDADKYHADLKKKNEYRGTGNITVIMSPDEKTSEVKDIKNITVEHNSGYIDQHYRKTNN